MNQAVFWHASFLKFQIKLWEILKGSWKPLSQYYILLYAMGHATLCLHYFYFSNSGIQTSDFFLLKLGPLGSSIRLLPPCRELLDTSKDTGWTTCLNYFSTHFGWDWRIASYVRLTPASPSDLKKMVPSDLGFFF